MRMKFFNFCMRTVGTPSFSKEGEHIGVWEAFNIP